MPPATRVRAFLIVFTVLCLVALGLVLLAEFSGYQWAKRAVSVAQNFGRMVFAVVAVTFITVEGVPLMLAAWFRKEQIREAREEGIEIGEARGHIRGHAEGRTEGRAEGRAEAMQLVLEAENQRREGETLAQAIARLQAERENLR